MVVHKSFYWGSVLLAATFGAACSDDEGEKAGASMSPDAGEMDMDSEQDDESMPAFNEGGTDPLERMPDDVALPIVFVHGFAGSAQQFTSQAMRYVANGYPPERLRAYEHDGAGFAIADYVSGLDAVVDEVRATFNADKVYLMGHSRGTAVSSSYLSEPSRADKVAKYVSLDGAGCNNIPVPCRAPAQTTNTREGQTDHLPGQKHVEVATSKESFEIQFEFFFDKKPEVVDIVKQRDPVKISGRAVNFPANTGREDTTLEVWAIDADTGMRTKDEPMAKFDLQGEGEWGPVTVDPTKHYELSLLSTDGSTDTVQHFYMQPFLRSSQFIRLLSGPPDSDSRVHTNTGDGHAGLIAMRMREWTPDDVLEVSDKSDSGDSEPKNVLENSTASDRIAIFLHDDAASPGETTLDPLPWFTDQPFQTGVDIFLPAKDKPDGTITLKNLPRGDADKPQALHVPNWASTNHTISVMFNDFPQD